MNKMKKCFIWYLMSSKRLLRKLSFVILLLIIPLVIPVANSIMSQESGVIKVVLCAEDKNEMSANIIKTLLDKDSIINFSRCDTAIEAEEAVKNNRADAAWIFVNDFDKKVDEYGKNPEAGPLVRVVERESTISLQLSKEVLYGAMFRDVSYSVYKNFTYSNVVTPEEVSEEKMEEVYNELVRNGSVVELWRLDSGEIKEQENYLTAPMRGLMSLVVVLCSLAAALYFLSDQKEGKYDWLSPKMRLAPAFALCFGASVFAGFAVVVALLMSGYSVGVLHELVSMIIFILMTTGFALFFCVLFKSPGKLGATLPGIMIVMLVLSPIFIAFKILRPIRLMLPTHYYLYGVYNYEYWLYGILYCVGIYGVVFLINHIKKNTSRGSAI